MANRREGGVLLIGEVGLKRGHGLFVKIDCGKAVEPSAQHAEGEAAATAKKVNECGRNAHLLNWYEWTFILSSLS